MEYAVEAEEMLANKWRPVDYIMLDKSLIGDKWIPNMLDMYFLNWIRWN